MPRSLGWILFALVTAMWPSMVAAQQPGRFSIDAQWTIAPTSSSPHAAEYAAGSHPDGVMTRYLAEGAASAFFNTSIALFLTRRRGDQVGGVVTEERLQCFARREHHAAAARQLIIVVPAGARRTIDASTIDGLANESFSTVIESDRAIVVDRTMTWGDGYGSHADTAIVTPSTTWFLAEGSAACLGTARPERLVSNARLGRIGSGRWFRREHTLRSASE